MSENLRVFEFAKEIGMETLTLMDKLRDWEIAVKSHMASLNPETQELIRERLQTESGAQKKKTTKKKATTKAAKTKKKATTKAKAKKTTVKKAVTSKTKKTVTKKAAASAASADDKGSKRVIRRKAGAAKQAETAEKKLQEVKSSTVKVVKKEEELEGVLDNTQEAVQETQAAEATQEVTEKKVARRPKNIVGKIDLSKVEDFKRRRNDSAPRGAAGADRGARGPGARPTGGRPGTGGTAGSGYVAPPIDSGLGSSRKDKARKKLAPRVDEGPKVDPTAEEQLSFNKADYKKREALFQPKKKKVQLGREALKTQITKPKAAKRVVKVDNSMSVAELAQQLKVKSGQIIGHLMKEGMMVRQTDILDFDTIALICPEFDYEAQNVHQSIDDLVSESKGDVNPEDLLPRAAVVTVMGHVDHGKTSILDAIRSSDVASGEAGGITQHIGAYRVKLPDGNYITFLDTPGHEAFTAMRARGANATDIAVVVVAADDGVMPQTAEAINHAKAAGVPIIVAVNKMDRPNASPDKIKQQLTEFELVPEEWGGETVFIPTSAINNEGIAELLEAINLQAEILELKSNPKIPGEGIVIESKMEKGRGVVATLLVQEGSIKKGDYIVAGPHYGRVRALINDHGAQLDEVGPSVPAEVLGLNGTPSAGDKVDVVKNERAAKEIADRRQLEIDQSKNIVPSSKMSLEDLFSKVQTGDVKELNVVLKSDVAGSAEAIKGLFEKIATSKVKIKVVHDAVGGITESDVLLASTSNAIIVGFNVRPDGGAQNSAKKHGVQIKSYNIIYEIADDIRLAMRGVLDPKIVEEAQGSAEVRELFRVPSIGTIAGCFVLDGKIIRDSLLRLVRDGTVVYEGNVSSLRRFKDNVKEVVKDYECGIGIENFNDIKVGDIIEAYKKVEVEAELED